MQYLVDTGVLLRLFDRSDPEHRTIRATLRRLREEGHVICATYQNVAEFWNVSTRPVSARGGYGESLSSTERRAQFIERIGTILTDHPGAYEEWRQLVVQHQVQGASVHDARLVAMMRVSSTPTIITLNGSDFARYPGVTALSPAEVQASFK